MFKLNSDSEIVQALYEFEDAVEDSDNKTEDESDNE